MALRENVERTVAAGCVGRENREESIGFVWLVWVWVVLLVSDSGRERYAQKA
jgi:hypothetical protein